MSTHTVVMHQDSPKFNVLDNLSFTTRTMILIICGLACCWGFVNHTILLVFAGKMGFPFGVAVAAILIDRKNVAALLWYTVLLVVLGTLFFTIYQVEIDPNLTKHYVPNWFDFLLGLGLGLLLSNLWHHSLRINIIVMAAALASLLPACIMIGYFFSRLELMHAFASFELYLQYVFGILLGAWLEPKIAHKT